MPFVAKLRSTGERVDITKIDNPRQILKANDVICALPDCGSPMIIKAGLIVRSHFAHATNAECRSQFGSHPESAEHRFGKMMIAEQLRKEMDGYSEAVIEYEVPIPEVRRVADVLAIFPSGWRVAHECQLAAITIRDLEQRTEDYLHAGVDVIWWLGKSAATEANLSWCYYHQGFALELSFLHRSGSGTLVPGENFDPPSNLRIAYRGQ